MSKRAIGKIKAFGEQEKHENKHKNAELSHKKREVTVLCFCFVRSNLHKKTCNGKTHGVSIRRCMTDIKKLAFYGCKKLKSITISTTKLTKSNVGSNAFKGINAKCIKQGNYS